MNEYKQTFYFNPKQNPIDSFLEGFELGRISNGVSPATIKFYKEKLVLWFDWCHQVGINTIGDLTAPSIRAYLVQYAETHSQGGAHGIFRSIRVYLNWIWEEYEFEIPNPIKKVKCSNRQPDPIKGVAPEDIDKLFKAASEGQFPERDCAILAILLDTGIRKMSLYNIHKEDIDIITGSIYIRHSKNRKPFTVYLGKKARKYVRKFMSTISDLPKESIVWISREGGIMRMDNIPNILRAITTRAGVTGYSTHDFRRCFALQAYKAGADVFAVSEMLHHSDISITKRYLAITEDDRKEMHARFSPLDHR